MGHVQRGGDEKMAGEDAGRKVDHNLQ